MNWEASLVLLHRNIFGHSIWISSRHCLHFIVGNRDAHNIFMPIYSISIQYIAILHTLATHAPSVVVSRLSFYSNLHILLNIFSFANSFGNWLRCSSCLSWLLKLRKRTSLGKNIASSRYRLRRRYIIYFLATNSLATFSVNDCPRNTEQHVGFKLQASPL